MTKVAEESTFYHEKASSSPRVISSMVKSALAKAISEVGKFLSLSMTKDNIDGTNLQLEMIHIDRRIENASRIIRAAYQGYDGYLKNLDSGAEAVFNAVWNTIPCSLTVQKAYSTNATRKKNSPIVFGKNNAHDTSYEC